MDEPDKHASCKTQEDDKHTAAAAAAAAARYGCCLLDKYSTHYCLISGNPLPPSALPSGSVDATRRIFLTSRGQNPSDVKFCYITETRFKSKENHKSQKQIT
ncbi:hypothetical protein E2C01_013854 [Portunus trituberculatus]|uniref:Uncharacterized protein n=1 Tax=Portunus trituberculatus TaxID=210409 RepID=A0A5B7DHB6_PORTR|nr:hypothetical protein [Portunus trituberculatus]